MEMDLNMKFRQEFSSLQHFKFFTEDQLNGIDAKLNAAELNIKVMKDTQREQEHTLNVI